MDAGTLDQTSVLHARRCHTVAQLVRWSTGHYISVPAVESDVLSRREEGVELLGGARCSDMIWAGVGINATFR